MEIFEAPLRGSTGVEQNLSWLASKDKLSNKDNVTHPSDAQEAAASPLGRESQVEVVFRTKITDDVHIIPPEQAATFLPVSVNRYGLGEIINQLLKSKREAAQSDIERKKDILGKERADVAAVLDELRLQKSKLDKEDRSQTKEKKEALEHEREKAKTREQEIERQLDELVGVEDTPCYDILVELPGNDRHPEKRRLYLKSSLDKFMKLHKITTESRLVLYYSLARSAPESSFCISSSEWIVALSPEWVESNSGRILTIATAGTDGVCQMLEMGVNGNKVAADTVTRRTATLVTKASAVPLSGVATFSPSDVWRLPDPYVQVLTTSIAGEITFGYRRLGKEADVNIEMLAKGKGTGGAYESVSLSLDGSTAYAGCLNGTIDVYDNEECLELAMNAAGAKREDEANPSSRKRKLSSEGVREAQPKGRLSGHTEIVTGFCCPKGANMFNLFSASLDDTVRVWDTPSQSCVTSWSTVNAANSVSASPTVNKFCTSHADGRVRVWDIREANNKSSPAMELSQPAAITENHLAVFNTSFYIHQRNVSQAAWNPVDENLIASVSHDTTLKLADLRYPKAALMSLSSKHIKLLCLDWIDEHNVMTGGSDSTLRVHYMH